MLWLQVNPLNGRNGEHSALHFPLVPLLIYSLAPSLSPPPQVHHGAHLGLPAQRGGRLHLSLPPGGPEDSQAQEAAGVVQEDAGQGLRREDPPRLQGKHRQRGKRMTAFGQSWHTSCTRCRESFEEPPYHEIWRGNASLLGFRS